MEKSNAVVIDPDPKDRAVLKSALHAISNYNKIFQAKSIRDCLSLMKEEESELLINFISYEFPKEEIGRLVAQGKSTPGGVDSAYVIVFKSDEQDSGTIARSLLDGIDGFVVAPYSVESLAKITKLAEKLKKERRQSRIEKTVKFLVEDTLATLDEVAARKLSGASPGEMVKRWKNQSDSIHYLDAELLPYYFKVLMELCDEAIPFAYHEKKQKTEESRLQSESRKNPKIGASPVSVMNRIKAIRGR
ncbi:MAG: hypothetical protein KDD70_16045 [Bdellovibrionales bacterium]|nr:hypothetical protein [Bdellovibrionales bacterium]